MSSTDIKGLSPREQLIFDHLQKHGETPLERLAYICNARKEAVIMAIKSMALKLGPTRFRIIKTAGGRGKGNKGRYKLERVK